MLKVDGWNRCGRRGQEVAGITGITAVSKFVNSSRIRQPYCPHALFDLCVCAIYSFLACFRVSRNENVHTFCPIGTLGIHVPSVQTLRTRGNAKET
jgi:hypothetical protein